MSHRPEGRVRDAMTLGLELVERGETAPDADVGMALDALKAGLGIAAVRRLVWWHIEHPKDRSASWLLHGADGGEAWARDVLRTHAVGVSRGDHVRAAASVLEQGLGMMEDVAPGALPIAAGLRGLRDLFGQGRAAAAQAMEAAADSIPVRAWVNGVEVKATLEQDQQKGRRR